MPEESCVTKGPAGLGFFEKYLTVWVLLLPILPGCEGDEGPLHRDPDRY